MQKTKDFILKKDYNGTKFETIYAELLEKYNHTMLKVDVAKEINKKVSQIEYAVRKGKFPPKIQVKDGKNELATWATYDIAHYITYGFKV
jgi:hypothetical protein